MVAVVGGGAVWEGLAVGLAVELAKAGSGSGGGGLDGGDGGVVAPGKLLVGAVLVVEGEEGVAVEVAQRWVGEDGHGALGEVVVVEVTEGGGLGGGAGLGVGGVVVAEGGEAEMVAVGVVVGMRGGQGGGVGDGVAV